MSVSYRTLKDKLDRMEKQVKFQHARLVDPQLVDDAEYDVLMAVLDDMRAWMEEV
jgi:tetrahydromethanopterin S-methyltransferase subunit G